MGVFVGGTGVLNDEQTTVGVVRGSGGYDKGYLLFFSVCSEESRIVRSSWYLVHGTWYLVLSTISLLSSLSVSRNERKEFAKVATGGVFVQCSVVHGSRVPILKSKI